jgi:2-iminobutanoate/2-iminopropanoate deaminase
VRRRLTIEIGGVAHGKAPIPMAARVGNMVWSSAIPGKDASTGLLPPDGPAQVAAVFENAAAVLTAAGVTRDDVVYISVLLTSDELRPEVNRHWLAWFPDADDRPARHVTLQPLAGGMLVQLQLVAVAEQPYAR